MPDVEKVLQALEHCDLCGDMPNCPGCAYLREHDCDEHLKRDIIALLKAQEPRVMTLSEVRNLKESTPVWLEDVNKKDVIGALFMRDYSGTKCVDFAIVRDWEFECVVADYMDYGIGWRCWTSRPDEKRRAETPWN